MVTATDPAAALQAPFLSILPRIERHAQFCFRDLRCPHRRAEAVQEAIDLAWRYFVRLAERGKNPLAFPSTLAAYAARHVRCGRRLCGRENGKDVLSHLARWRHGFAVEALPSSTAASFEDRYAGVRGQQRQDAFEERLRDNAQTPVPEQVAFRIDFPSWRLAHTDRTRRIIDALGAGERRQDVARSFGLSPARISQMRRELHADWCRFQGDDLNVARP
ncbi:MAG: hypothetical protein ACJ8F7_20570 [Gemmataceae bacterium]